MSMASPKRAQASALEDGLPQKKRSLTKTARAQRAPAWQLDDELDRGDSQPIAPQQRALQNAALAHSLVHDARCSPAWSCTNLLALPTPQSLSSSFSSTMTHHCKITLTHLTGSPSSPHPRLSFTLDLPPSSTANHITSLSFSPCGAYLLASSASEAIEEDDILTVFEQSDGCLNEWSIIWHESLARFGDKTSGQTKSMVRSRWIGEPRKWWPSTDHSSSRPFFASPPRSSPVPGCAFLAILSSSEVLFVHLNRATPLIPLTAILPLYPAPPHAHLSLVALPTPGSYIPGSTSPANAVDSIVANLIDASASAPTTTTTSGGDALKQELKAAEASNSSSSHRVLSKAALGIVGGRTSAVRLGETTFLIATRSRPVQRRRVETKRPIVEEKKKKLVVVEEMKSVYARDSPDPDDDEFGLTDFNALDAAFGAPVPVKPVESDETESDAVEREDEEGLEADEERMIELSQVKIETGLVATEGPKISLKPLSPVFEDGTEGELIGLNWIEHLTPSSTDGEGSTDLRLLAVTASSSSEGRYSSTLTSWAFCEEPYALSEAFSTLEQKKGDATVGPKEWTSQRAASVVKEGLVSCLATTGSTRFGTFAMGIEEGSTTVGTTLVLVDSSSLEDVSVVARTQLPRSELYTDLAFSPNGALVCALPFGPSRLHRPTISAMSLGESRQDAASLSTHFALSLIRQGESSDVIGRIIGAKDDLLTLTIAREVRDKLRRSLPASVVFENTAVMFELLGVYATIYNASSGLSLRGSIASDLLRLGVCLRAYHKCERRERNAAASSSDVPPAYRCESDAVWPLISHASWFCDFARLLSQTCSNDPKHPRHVLLLHPFSRNLLLLIIDVVLGLQAFLRSFPVHQNFTVDLAKTVLDDAIEYNGLILIEFRKALVKIGEEVKTPSSDDVERNAVFVGMLVEFSLPATLSDATGSISSLLSSPALYLPKGLPTPVEDEGATYDVVRKSKLDDGGAFKRCSRCGERTEKKIGNETGKWAAYELAWEGKCMCGGLWVGQKVEQG